MRVSGSDMASSPITENLKRWVLRSTLDISRITLRRYGCCGCFFCYTSQNIELSTARQRGLDVLSGRTAGAIDGFLSGIAITGSHGKTTTSAMISVLLTENGYDHLSGRGHIAALGGNARLGRGAYLVAESDESDGSFLKQMPNIAVITNIDDDHLDYYNDLTEF